MAGPQATGVHRDRPAVGLGKPLDISGPACLPMSSCIMAWLGVPRRGSELVEAHSAPLLGQWRERLWKN